jgi:hypothetical protein
MPNLRWLSLSGLWCSAAQFGNMISGLRDQLTHLTLVDCSIKAHWNHEMSSNVPRSWRSVFRELALVPGLESLHLERLERSGPCETHDLQSAGAHKESDIRAVWFTEDQVRKGLESLLRAQCTLMAKQPSSRKSQGEPYLKLLENQFSKAEGVVLGRTGRPVRVYQARMTSTYYVGFVADFGATKPSSSSRGVTM